MKVALHFKHLGMKTVYEQGHEWKYDDEARPKHDAASLEAWGRSVVKGLNEKTAENEQPIEFISVELLEPPQPPKRKPRIKPNKETADDAESADA